MALTAWPALYGTDFLRENAWLYGTWVLGCLSMSVFTLLAVVKVEDANMILIGGILMLLLGVMYIAFEKSLLVASDAEKTGLASKQPDGISRSILGVQVRELTPSPQALQRRIY